MKEIPLPPADYMNDRLDYDKDTGLLYWRARPESDFADLATYKKWNSRFMGKRAFYSAGTHGYLIGTLDSIRYKAHRIIWKMVYGEDPLHIDHINGIPHDNRLRNLRSVTKTENRRNIRRPSNNTSGVVGVSYFKRDGKWSAFLGRKWLGIFPTKEEAITARIIAQRAAGYHPNHGRISPGQSLLQTHS